MKLLIGGSPCTHWSIAQTKNRETEASGIGWELFLNYRIARDKYQPDFFLYENNKSMAPAIKAQISKELGVEPVLINSALVSAQNRQRLYWAGRRNPDGTYSQVAVEQPEDMGILLRDILESGVCWREKAYTLKANYFKSSVTNAMDGGHFPSPMAAEPIIVNGMESGKARTVDAHMGKLESNLVPRINNPNPAKQQYDCIAVPVPEPVNETVDGKAQCLRATYYKDGIRNMVGNTIDRKTCVAEPVRIGTIENDAKNQIFDSQQYRVYSPDAKSVTLCGNGGGLGAKTGLYAVPVIPDGKGQFVIKAAGGKEIPVYEVRGGRITIKGKEYPIKLADGFYIIRKLTVTECKRLQTVPDTYAFPVSDT